MHKKVVVLLLSSIFACFFLYFVERILVVSYEVKTLCKILLFTIIPFFYWMYFKKSSSSLEKKKTFVLSIALSIATFSIIIISYLLFKTLVDFNSIKSELSLDESEFLYRGIYIIFGNSFLEELFFRGYIFLNLYRLGLKKTSYVFSAVLFAIYHIAIFQSWFSLPIMLLVLFSLFTVGLIFNYLCTRVSSFIGSWMVHASADLAIILIGWYTFYSL